MKRLFTLTTLAASICILSACSGTTDSKQDLAKLKNISPKDAYAMGSAFVAKGANGDGIDSYIKCTNRLAESIKYHDEASQMDYGGEYKIGCERIFKQVQTALNKKGIHVSLKTVQNPTIARLLVNKHDRYSCLQNAKKAGYSDVYTKELCG